MTVRRRGTKGFVVLAGIANLLAIGVANAGELAYLALTEGYWEVWVSETDGAGARQLTRFGADISRLSWYADGRRLFVNRLDGRWFEVEVASGRARELSPPARGILDAVISPVDDVVAYSLGTGSSIDDNDIWLYETSAQQARKLTQLPQLQHEPTWSPDGRYVYFLSGNGGRAHDIWRVDSAGATTEQLTVNEVYHFDPAVRADGALAYSANRSGNYEIWVDEPGRDPRRLTKHPGLDARPTWSADGRSLVFESARGGDVALYQVAVSDGKATPLMRQKRPARLPVIFNAQAVP